MKRSRYLFVGSLLGAIATLATQELRRRRVTRVLPEPWSPPADPIETEATPERRRRVRRTHRLAVAVAGLALLAAGLATAAYATGWHSTWHRLDGDGNGNQNGNGNGNGNGSGNGNGWQARHHRHSGPPVGTSTTAPVTTVATSTVATTTTEEPPTTSTVDEPTTTTVATSTVATTAPETTSPTTSTAPTTTAVTSTAPTTTDTAPTTIAQTTTTQPTTTTQAPTYPWHQNITSTVFWVGEPQGNGSSEDNSISAYDDDWEQHYGGYDNYAVTRVPPTYTNGLGFTPLQNAFYLDLPYDDVNDSTAFNDRCQVVPWASEYPASDCRNQSFSYMKNQWVEIQHTVNAVTYTAYGQIEDAGPYVYDDEAYVFGSSPPDSREANNAGLDVSPALRDYLHFGGTSPADQLNNDENEVTWRFVDASDVPTGPWTITVTTQQVYQP